MYLELRLYKRFDGDLLALKRQGLPVAKMTKQALVSYANGKKTRFLIPACQPYDINGEQRYHVRIHISDAAACELLKHIKHGYRNSFAKAILRDALVTQSLGVYFSDSDESKKYFEKENSRISSFRDDENILIPRVSEDDGEKIVAEKKKPVRHRKKSVKAAAPAAPVPVSSVHEEKTPEAPVSAAPAFHKVSGIHLRTDAAVPAAVKTGSEDPASLAANDIYDDETQDMLLDVFDKIMA